MATSVVLEEALADLPKVLETNGLRSAGCAVVNTWMKVNRTAARVVLQVRLNDGRQVIYKQVFDPAGRDNFEAMLDAQLDAAEHLLHHPADRAPMVLGYDEGRCALVLEHLEGETLADLMERGEDHAWALKRGGQWLGAYHGSSHVEMRSFRGGPLFGKLEQAIGQVRSGRVAIPHPALFLDCAGSLAQFADHLGNVRGIVAMRHGDMTCRNLILKEDICWGIDFSPDNRLPAAFDVARLIVHYATNFPQPDDIPDGNVIDPRLLRAFFRGYSLFEPDDMVFQIFLRSRVLMNWLAMARSGEDEFLQNMARTASIESMASRLFAVEAAHILR